MSAPYAPGQRTEICLDGRNQVLRDGTGVFNYARTVATGLASLGRRADILLDGQIGASPPQQLSRYARAAVPWPVRASETHSAPPGFANAWIARDIFRSSQIHFNIYGRLRRLRCGTPPRIMHWTYPLPILFRNSTNIYTIHDLIPLTHSSLTSIEPGRYERIVKQVVQEADHIVTVSETSKRDIMNLLGVSADRITNTYQPVSLSSAAPGTAIRLPYRYFVFCGVIEARKNLSRLIMAHRLSNTGMPLILAGPSGPDADRLLLAAGVQDLPLAAMPAAGAPGVWRLPWLERDALTDLLAGARALLFPSLAEGFGLPIVEAMALGVPVMTSRGGATGEIAGDAALLVDPKNVADMADAIRTLERDGERVRDLIAKGYRRAECFTPSACLQRLDGVYRKFGNAVE